MQAMLKIRYPHISDLNEQPQRTHSIFSRILFDIIRTFSNSAKKKILKLYGRDCTLTANTVRLTQLFGYMENCRTFPV